MGFYVPSKSFIYYPYKKIFTRINGDDNIFKGMSSFAVEMDELRSILKYSDNRSIVLGDEICKGTEETSALAIVSASIMRFCKNNVNFIMATHFHKLCDLECVKRCNNIKYKHLTITYDEENGTIIYGRKLENGPGSNLYGIEIANYIIDDEDFIENAKRVRNGILNINNELIVNKTSNYNNKLYMECCSICGDNGITYPLDTHHINEQHEFDKDDIQKDKLNNLVVLCKKHHDEVHYGNLYIDGYKDTITGKILSYKYIDSESIEAEPNENSEPIETTENKETVETIKKNQKTSKKKYNDMDIELIKIIAEKAKGQIDFIKFISNGYMKEKGVNISKRTIEKMLNDNY
jgi:DNA mismatch repair protein MutS